DESKYYLYTSFTGGTIMGRNMTSLTSNLKLMLTANGIPFEIVDVATDDRARRIWTRRSNGKLLPGLVKGEDVVGNYEDLEDANEYGELLDMVTE
ncbi:hypothetical protein V1512DRAFT_197412, partial [Lipomyces arxii]|uniref:uncharacterized protein n=1 Tax=Lipomyces arxii TaxID=56418 RepID=UPI0034CF0345